jgi:iron complex outermembrane receptor protein
VSAFYSFEKQLSGLQLGLLASYFGKRYAGRSTRVQVANDAYKPVALPDYMQFDASAAYTFKQFTLRAKLGNILNVLSYNVHDDNSVNPIAPRNYQLNLCYKF